MTASSGPKHSTYYGLSAPSAAEAGNNIHSHCVRGACLFFVFLKETNKMRVTVFGSENVTMSHTTLAPKQKITV